MAEQEAKGKEQGSSAKRGGIALARLHQKMVQLVTFA